jgi:uncharacterized protein DUF3859
VRIRLSLLLVTFLSVNAYAQGPQVERIDVVEYGIYAANKRSVVSAPNTATGSRHLLNGIRHVESTRTVPARLGVRFGFRYTVVGAPAGTPVALHIVTIFPPPGLQNPATRQIKAQSEYDIQTTIGNSPYKDYGFDHDWELVPGIWTMQVWYQGRKLVEQEFTVAKQ